MRLMTKTLVPTPPHSTSTIATTPSTLASSSPGAFSLGSFYKQSPGSSGKGTPSSLGQSRYDSSLGLLTKKFVHILRSSPGKTLDLNHASKELRVQKRRIYDITNVLEGIGLLTKQGKNNVSWNSEPTVDLSHAPDFVDPDTIGSPPRIEKTTGVPTSAVVEEVRKELHDLKGEEQQLDQYLEFLSRQSIQYNAEWLASYGANHEGLHPGYLPRGMKSAKDLLYVRYSDITGLPSYGRDTIIGIKAPTGTNLEVPDPDQGTRTSSRGYQMFLSSKAPVGGPVHPHSSKGPIHVYLVRPEGKSNKSGSPERAPAETATESREPSSSGFEQESQGQEAVAATPDTQQTPPTYEPYSGSSKPSYYPSGDRGQTYPSYPYGGPPPPYYHHDPAWGPPPQYPGQHYPPPPPAKRARTGAKKVSLEDSSKGLSPDRGQYHLSLKPRSTPDRSTTEEGDAFLESANDFGPPGDAPPTPLPPLAMYSEGGPLSPPWGRPSSQYGAYDESRGHGGPITGSSSFGMPRPPSPAAMQQDLFNMPLQSPGRGFGPPGYMLSPTVPPGFSPAGPHIGQAFRSDVQFPMPHLQAGEGDSRVPPWQRGMPRELPDVGEADTPPRGESGEGSTVKPRPRR